MDKGSCGRSGCYCEVGCILTMRFINIHAVMFRYGGAEPGDRTMVRYVT